MGTAPIKEIGFPFAIPTGPEAPDRTQGTDGIFAKVMTEATARSGQTVVAQGDVDVIKQASPVRVNKTGGSEAGKVDDNDSYKKESQNSQNRPAVDDMEAAGKAVEEKTGEIRDAIMEKLDISDEEFEEAMAAM